MSVYKRPGHEAYSYDFRLSGRRYSGNTEKTTKREAEREEQRIRREIEALKKHANAPLTVGTAFTRYWTEVGQHHKNADTTLANLEWMQVHLGKSKRLDGVTSADIAVLIAKKRGAREGKPILPATVNRSVTVLLRQIFIRARDIWKVPVQEIDWTRQMLKEPQERVRELSVEEEEKLFAALRQDYHPIVRFALWTGCRMQECLDLKWRDIDWHNSEITVTGKGSKTRTFPMTGDVRALLRFLPRSGDRVFTSESKRADHAPRGSRIPIGREALKSTMRRSIDKAGIHDFHFHDLRHTCATRLLRATGNLRIVRDLLGHEDMQTTLKYAHVTKDDLRAAMETASATQNLTARGQEDDKILKTNEDGD